MLRLIDANLDRVGEGLRVLEETARFLLDDAELCHQLKSLRHRLARSIPVPEHRLVAARRVREDVGAFAAGRGAAKHEDLQTLVKANARRAQESLRVLEEFARLANSPLAKPGKYERSRYDLYDLEQKLISRLLRRELAGRLAGVYLILDTMSVGGRDVVDVAVQAIRGGVKVIQLRHKRHGKAEQLGIAHRVRQLCAQKQVLFIVNDYLDIALAARADGLHLGQGDLPVAEARRVLPLNMLVGCSTTTVAQAKRAQSSGADYIAVGSIYPTSSKERYRLVGLEALRRIRQRVSLPLVAVGGIKADNAGAVIEAGANGVAVISAVLGAEDVEGAARDLVNSVAKYSSGETEHGQSNF